MITGYVPGTTLPAGTVQKLSCISSGGNPLATLTWFKNDKKVSILTLQIKILMWYLEEQNLITNATIFCYVISCILYCAGKYRKSQMENDFKCRQ